MTEKFIDVPGGQVFTCMYSKSIGASPLGAGMFSQIRRLFQRERPSKQAMLVIHGGPGYPHNYLLSLSPLADLIPVIFYDQLGCGRSSRSENIALWRISRFVEEIEAIRTAYGLESLILYGHSWGTILANEYRLRYPEIVKALILESPCFSIPRWREDAAVFIGSLPEDVQKVISQSLTSYKFNSPDFNSAVDLYYQKYVHPERPKPEVLKICDAGSSSQVYTTMWGPCEFILTGSLRDYDRSDSLNGISVPALFTSGEFDEVRPETLISYVNEVEGSQYQIFKGAHHFPHLECHDEYNQLMRDFLQPIIFTANN